MPLKGTFSEEAGESLWMAEVPGELQEKLLGQHDLTIQMVEERYPVRMMLRGETLLLRSPDAEPIRTVAKLLQELAKLAEKGIRVTREEVRYGMDALAENGSVDLAGPSREHHMLYRPWQTRAYPNPGTEALHGGHPEKLRGLLYRSCGNGEDLSGGWPRRWPC